MTKVNDARLRGMLAHIGPPSADLAVSYRTDELHSILTELLERRTSQPVAQGSTTNSAITVIAAASPPSQGEPVAVKGLDDYAVLQSCLESFWCMTTAGTADRLLAEGAIDAAKRIRSVLSPAPSLAVSDEMRKRAWEAWKVSSFTNDMGKLDEALTAALRASHE